MKPITLHGAFLRIVGERKRQDELHPRDDWPLCREPGSDVWIARRDALQADNDVSERQGSLSWFALLLEELTEACAETSRWKQAIELLQLATLAIRAACALTREDR